MANEVASQDSKIGVETTPGGGTYTDIGNITGYSGPSGSKPEIDVTTLVDSAQRFIAGLPDYGQVDCEGNFQDTEDAGMAIVRANYEASGATNINFRITIGTATGDFSGYVNALAYASAAGGKADLNFSIRVSGAVTWTFS